MVFEGRHDRRPSVAKKDSTPSERVIWAISEAEDVDPTELRSLHDVVDPDALDALFHGSTVGSVTFEYHGYTVTVRDSDDVFVQEPTSANQQ